MTIEESKPRFFDPMTEVFVKDVEVSIEFYMNNFGFIETFRDNKIGKPDHVELELGNFKIAISSINAARNIHNLNVGSDIPKGALVFWTKNTDQIYEDLIKNGAQEIKKPHDFRGKIATGMDS